MMVLRVCAPICGVMQQTRRAGKIVVVIRSGTHGLLLGKKSEEKRSSIDDETQTTTC